MQRSATDVTRSKDCKNSPRSARAETIALALMGVEDLPPRVLADVLADAAIWQRAGGAVTGRDAVLGAVETGLDAIVVDQVVSHGKAASVSGTLTRGGDRRLFCHVIRFTSVAAVQVGQIVSFEHAG